MTATQQRGVQPRNDACSLSVTQAGDLGCFRCSNCAKPYISAAWYQNHLNECPQPTRAITQGLTLTVSLVISVSTITKTVKGYIASALTDLCCCCVLSTAISLSLQLFCICWAVQNALNLCQLYG